LNYIDTKNHLASLKIKKMKVFLYCFLFVLIINSVHLQLVPKERLDNSIGLGIVFGNNTVINGVYDSTNSDCSESCNCKLFGLKINGLSINKGERSNITLNINCKKEIEKIKLPVKITDVLYTTTLNLQNIGF
jgi:hypothetical protein